MGKIVGTNGQPINGEPQNKEKPEQVVEKIPEKLLNPILEAQKEAITLNRKFGMMSHKVVSMQRELVKIQEKLETVDKSIQSKIKRSFDKMKLGKRKNVRWTVDLQKQSFIGTVVPEKKLPENKG